MFIMMMPSRHMPFPPMRYYSREQGDKIRYEPVDRYGRHYDFSVDVEDLAIDGRGRTSDVRVVDVRTIDPRDLDRDSPPRCDYQRQLGSNFAGPARRESRLRGVMAGRKSSVSFGRGMKKLYGALDKAEQYFNNFIQEYDNDMGSTEKYATLEIREQLWKLKVAGKRDKRTIKDDDNQPNDEGSDKPKQKFLEKKKDLNHALQLALTVGLEDDRQTSRAKARKESAKRLQNKIDVASTQIGELLDEAVKYRDQCQALLDEIKMLKVLVDPETETNKDLFKLVDGEQGGSSDAEEERGSGREGWEN
ncbi:uncharacterized protein PAC_04930 [Phialocephala subalpina]|uniref:Uncharacterized protein n=1 Tax=Phialocephala subalpina TaxID=576137 RepID=A0A1L7WQJ4_9HELO|nr:uncharacterized protein PAC_04930 [Phialocephala subalpina]